MQDRDLYAQILGILDISARNLSRQIPTDSENQRVALSPDQHWLVTILVPDHKIAFYRTADDQLDFTIPVDGVPFTRIKRRIVSCSNKCNSCI